MTDRLESGEASQVHTQKYTRNIHSKIYTQPLLSVHYTCHALETDANRSLPPVRDWGTGEASWGGTTYFIKKLGKTGKLPQILDGQSR